MSAETNSGRAPTPSIVLVGNPNAGKTTLFNALTGLSARVGNYPGITVEHREGRADLDGLAVRVVDLPGTYSLAPRSDDEVVAVRGMLGLLPAAGTADVVVVVIDGMALERNLYLLAQLRELPLPLVVAVTMTDTLTRDGRRLDVELLQRRVGVPVVAAPAVRGGADALRALLKAELSARTARMPMNAPAAPAVDDAAAALGHTLARALSVPGRDFAVASRALALFGAATVVAHTWRKLGLPTDAVHALDAVARAPAATKSLSVMCEQAVHERYARVEGWVTDVVSAVDGQPEQRTGLARAVQTPAALQRARGQEPRSAALTRKIDAVALHPVLGPIVLLLVFLALFQALFTWSTPLMDALEAMVRAVSDVVGDKLPAELPLLRSLVTKGVFAGVGNVVVFVPQIAVLFLFLALLEDSGYLARAAFILDRLMVRAGLHGRAFVPLLSGFACAVPAILATRTIESRRDRIVTILVTPLISCSARLPIYALMIATVFSTMPPILGVLAPGTVVMVAMYALSITAALVMARIFKGTLLKSPTAPLLLELPPYRMPRAGQVARAVLVRVRIFLTEAGTVILGITIVLWALFTFPRDDVGEAEHSARVSVLMQDATLTSDARTAAIADADAQAAAVQIERSFAGRAGKWIEPALSPLGFDWKLGVGIIASFAAREVLVSTLGLVYGLGDGANEENLSLRGHMQADTHEDGTKVYTPLVGLSLLVFFVLAMQCMSTLAAVKRETGGWRWPAFQFAYMSVLAYGAAFLVFQGGKLLGFT